MRRISLDIEPLSPETFAPYGTVIDVSGAPFYSRDRLDLWRLPFAADAPLRLQIMRYHHQPMVFSRLERHLHVTEGRFAMAGARGVLIVADETGPDASAAPDPASLRAFLLDGTGILFKPGVWHGLDCYPLDPPHADFLFLSDEATEEEVERLRAPVSGERTHVIDYADQGIEFEVRPPVA